jgi:probable selenium-dependent hydroxylase accessory protein YqeC
VESLNAWFEKIILNDESSSGKNGNRGVFPPVVTVIGSGGKTSLIWHLARSFSAKRRVLVSTTTRMLPPPADIADYKSITFMGKYNEADEKMESINIDTLKSSAYDYGCVLIEGDGSRNLPLKAWAGWEPVVPGFTSVTIGVMPVWPLGGKASPGLIHRLPLFTELTGAKEGALLTADHLALAISGRIFYGHASGAFTEKRGLFASASKRRILFFNQVENEEGVKNARLVLSRLKGEFRAGLEYAVAGSVHMDSISVLA